MDGQWTLALGTTKGSLTLGLELLCLINGSGRFCPFLFFASLYLMLNSGLRGRCRVRRLFFRLVQETDM